MLQLPQLLGWQLPASAENSSNWFDFECRAAVAVVDDCRRWQQLISQLIPCSYHCHFRSCCPCYTHYHFTRALRSQLLKCQLGTNFTLVTRTS